MQLTWTPLACEKARSRLYSTTPYFLARSLAESYLQATFGLVFGTACYGLVGLAPTMQQFVTFQALVTLATLVRCAASSCPLRVAIVHGLPAIYCAPAGTHLFKLRHLHYTPSS